MVAAATPSLANVLCSEVSSKQDVIETDEWAESAKRTSGRRPRSSPWTPVLDMGISVVVGENAAEGPMSRCCVEITGDDHIARFRSQVFVQLLEPDPPCRRRIVHGRRRVHVPQGNYPTGNIGFGPNRWEARSTALHDRR